MTTIAKFESLADYANKRSLAPYHGTRHAWVFINSDSLTLGQVAYAFYHSVMPDVEKWTDNDEIRFYKLLQETDGSLKAPKQLVRSTVLRASDGG